MSRRDRRPLHAPKPNIPKPVMPQGKGVGEPLNPTERVLSALARGDWTSALRLAKDLSGLGPDGEILSKAWEAHVHPTFFREMNKDSAALVEEGYAVLRRFLPKFTWKDVTIAIPSVPERQTMRSALILEIEKQCGKEQAGGPLIVVVERAEGELARTTFPKALATAARVLRPWVLQLEDDVHLAPTFGFAALKKLEKASSGGADVVTLFTRSKEDLVALQAGEPLRSIAPKSFSMSQAFFLRRDIAAEVETFAPGWYEQNPQHNRAADLLLAAYLSKRKARVMATIPSLVQHRPGKSTLPGHHGARQSESYRFAFGEIHS